MPRPKGSIIAQVRTRSRARGLSAVAVVAVAVSVLTACSGGVPDSGAFPLKAVEDVALPGASTRFDYQAIDPAVGRLYVAHLGDSEVTVVDLADSRVVATYRGIGSVHGLAVAPDRHLLIASAPDTNEVVLVDTRTGHEAGRAPAGDYPDGVAYDPASGRAYVSNEHGGGVTVVDIASRRALAPIDLGGDAGNVVFDATANTLYAAEQTHDDLVAIDPTTDRVTGRIHLPGCQGSHGVYVDGAHRLAFIGCEDNAKLDVLDLGTRRITATFRTGGTPDVLAFDASMHRLYVAAEDGTVNVLDESGHGLRQVAVAHLADSAHTVAVDQRTHRVYFPLEDVGGRPVLRVMRPAGSTSSPSP